MILLNTSKRPVLLNELSVRSSISWFPVIVRDGATSDLPSAEIKPASDLAGLAVLCQMAKSPLIGARAGSTGPYPRVNNLARSWVKSCAPSIPKILWKACKLASLRKKLPDSASQVLKLLPWGWFGPIRSLSRFTAGGKCACQTELAIEPAVHPELVSASWNWLSALVVVFWGGSISSQESCKLAPTLDSIAPVWDLSLIWGSDMTGSQKTGGWGSLYLKH